MAESSGHVQNFLKGETAGLPNWAWILVVVAGIAAAVVIPKLLGQQATGNADSSSSPDSGIGLAIDPTTGLPYAVEGLVPSGGLSGGGGGGGISTGGGGTTTPIPTPSGLIPLSGDTDNDDFFDPSTGTIVHIPKGNTNSTTSTTGGTTGTTSGTTTSGSSGTNPPKSSTGSSASTSKPSTTGSSSSSKPTTTTASKPASTPTKTPTAPVAQYVTAKAWPSPLGSLSGIASQSGISLARIEQLNPQITNPNLIYAGQKIRIA